MNIFRHLRSEEDKSCVTICFRLDATEQYHTSMVGIAVHPGHNGPWVRKKGVRIAEARASDSPLQFHFEGLPELQLHHAFVALKGLIIDAQGEDWREVDDTPLRPGRFRSRLGLPLLGPAGSLVTVFIDTNVRRVSDRPQVTERKSVLNFEEARDKPGAINHWFGRLPRWARDRIIEAESV